MLSVILNSVFMVVVLVIIGVILGDKIKRFTVSLILLFIIYSCTIIACHLEYSDNLELAIIMLNIYVIYFVIHLLTVIKSAIYLESIKKTLSIVFLMVLSILSFPWFAKLQFSLTTFLMSIVYVVGITLFHFPVIMIIRLIYKKMRSPKLENAEKAGVITESSANKNIKANIKSVKIIGIILAVYLVFCVITVAVLMKKPQWDNIAFLISFLIYPFFAGVYGIISYKTEQKIIGPCIMFLLPLVVIWFVFIVLLYGKIPPSEIGSAAYALYYLFGGFSESIKYTVPIVFTSAFITEYVSKSSKKRNEDFVGENEKSDITSDNNSKD